MIVVMRKLRLSILGFLIVTWAGCSPGEKPDEKFARLFGFPLPEGAQEVGMEDTLEGAWSSAHLAFHFTLPEEDMQGLFLTPPKGYGAWEELKPGSEEARELAEHGLETAGMSDLLISGRWEGTEQRFLVLDVKNGKVHAVLWEL